MMRVLGGDNRIVVIDLNDITKHRYAERPLEGVANCFPMGPSKICVAGKNGMIDFYKLEPKTNQTGATFVRNVVRTKYVIKELISLDAESLFMLALYRTVDSGDLKVGIFDTVTL